MKYMFIPLCVSCLDESISLWNNNFTCSEWMFYPKKPNHKGKEYHTICCEERRIMYRWELVEGKGRLKCLGSPDFETVPGTPTISLMWRMTKPLWGTWNLVVTDSGLCVLKRLIDMYER